MNREQQLRDKAYDIWRLEGCPNGRAEQHWAQAEAELAAMPNGAGAEIRDGEVTKVTKTTVSGRKTVKTAKK